MFVCVWNQIGVCINVWNEMLMWLPCYSIACEILCDTIYMEILFWLQTTHSKILLEFKFCIELSLAAQDSQMLIIGGI